MLVGSLKKTFSLINDSCLNFFSFGLMRFHLRKVFTAVLIEASPNLSRALSRNCAKSTLGTIKFIVEVGPVCRNLFSIFLPILLFFNL